PGHFWGRHTSVGCRPGADQHCRSRDRGLGDAASSASHESGSSPGPTVATEYEKVSCANSLGWSDRLVLRLLVFSWDRPNWNRGADPTSARLTGNPGRPVTGSSGGTASGDRECHSYAGDGGPHRHRIACRTDFCRSHHNAPWGEYD